MCELQKMYGCAKKTGVWQFLLLLGLTVISLGIFADDTGKDLLAGTSESLVKTLSGTGMKFVYLTEGIVSLAAYIKTKNLLVLSGVIVVSVFFNIILHIAGSTT